MRDEPTNERETKVNFLKKQRVIIKIWTSMANIHESGHNVGHVAIETPKKYMSLWPKQRYADQPSAKETEGKGISTPITHQLNTAQQDILYEGREPEYLFCLYTLNLDAIEEEYSKLEKSLQGWALVGGLLCDNAESCASLAWKLLEAGGIGKLVSVTEKGSVSTSQSTLTSLGSGRETTSASFNLSFFKSQAATENTQRSFSNSSYSSEMAVSLGIKSPDAVAEFVKQAKINELKRVSITQDISYEKETKTENNNSSCTII